MALNAISFLVYFMVLVLVPEDAIMTNRHTDDAKTFSSRVI